ncbi:unnamed protein product [Soboliphyme baturini]|uniref:Fibronectin type-III domain-containing protein n=1 Tax=Soboliphyme baturini TaxID=241478 RepID=A0A183IVE8_9BILA|nr:unnamed protein product [Soboliphyme baturini]
MAVNPSKRSVTLQFAPGYNGKTIISRWVVEAIVGNSTIWKEVFNISAPNATSIRVANLLPFHKYSLRVIAENAIGQSVPSLPSDVFETLQDLPESPPLEIDAQPSSATTIRVTWMVE